LIYSEYPELRSYQFLSIYTFIQEGIRAVTDPKTLEVAPTDLISKSKIFNLVTALHYKDLFGFDLIAQFKPTNAELEQAKNFLSEY
ncbi:MAG TPA: hypothetical protein PKD50_23755, partial [Leptospiraceae bacterium]|nr:hypothetical protein [Leptospiraceae bacterium]